MVAATMRWSSSCLQQASQREAAQCLQAEAETTRLAQRIATALSATQAWLLDDADDDDDDLRALRQRLASGLALVDEHSALQVRRFPCGLKLVLQVAAFPQPLPRSTPITAEVPFICAHKQSRTPLLSLAVR